MMPAKVLLFDEDYESMHDLELFLEEELGWEVELTAQPSILARLRSERFDLILVDLMIHEKSFDAEGNEVVNVSFKDVPWLRAGLEFLRRLRSGEYAGPDGTSPDVPVILLSALAGTSVKGEPNLHIGSYVEKPFRLEDLVGEMRRLLKE
jgi:CheY-like chemotaxis protein